MQRRLVLAALVASTCASIAVAAHDELDTHAAEAISFCNLEDINPSDETHVDANLSGPAVLCLYGEINASSERSLLKLMEKLSDSDDVTLVVRSPGGTVESALRIGDRIQSLNATVIVQTSCYSSCANYLFLASRRRIVLEDSLVWFHGGISKGFVEIMHSDLHNESSKRRPDREKIHWLRTNIADAPDQIESQRRLLQSAGVDIEFFSFFDDLNAMPRAKRETGCSSRKITMVAFSDRFFASIGVRMHVNLGPRDRIGFASLLEKRGLDSSTLCWWSGSGTALR